MTKIIIVDDDEASNYLTELIIKSVDANCKIQSFTNPKEVIDTINLLEIDENTILLLDLNMPEMNGWEFLDKFENTGKICKFFILTCSSSITEKENLEKYPNIKYFFTKPLAKQNIEFFLKN